MLICDKARMKDKKIWCDAVNGPCVHVRYCAVSMKYYQTDNAKKCLAREQDGEKHQTGALDRIGI